MRWLRTGPGMGMPRDCRTELDAPSAPITYEARMTLLFTRVMVDDGRHDRGVILDDRDELMVEQELSLGIRPCMSQ